MILVACACVIESMSGRFAAFLAAASVRSFPSMSECPNIHIISISRCVCLSMISSMQSQRSLIIDCPDCLRGRSIASRAV
jgi:hypothetical protein